MTTPELEFHPVADIFPMMSDREFRDLVEDINAYGLREPVWLYHDGRIIDGRNRYRACRQLGIEPETRMYEGDDTDLVFFVVSLNLHRRHLDESQRAMVAARIAQLPRGANQHVEISTPTQARAAEMLNVSRESVISAKKVQDHAEPEVAEAVAAGKVAVSTAATLADAPAETQRDLIAALDTADETARREAEKEIVKTANEIKRRKREVKQAAKAAAVVAVEETEPDEQPLPFEIERGQWWQLGPHRLYCGDSTDQEFITATEGAAFGFADPPYNAGKAVWDEGFRWGHDYLAKSCEIVAVTPGISAIADFYASTAMPYRWSIAAWITNGMTRGALGFGNWIYVALFSDAESLHRNAQDHLRLVVSTSTTGETSHASRKPAALMVDLIELFTVRGDLVVDPFLGSGTTLFTADKTGRRCVGAELEPDHCREIITRFGAEARQM